jgi:hypothetical protein
VERPRPSELPHCFPGRNFGNSAPPDAGRDRARHLDLHDVGAAGHAGHSERHPDPFFGTTRFAAPGLGIIASAVMLGFGMWWLGRAEAGVRRAFGAGEPAEMGKVTEDQALRDRTTTAREFDPAELPHGRHGATASRCLS